MDDYQFTTLMITMLGCFAFLIKEFKAVERDIKKEINIQSQRSDQLYTMFIDLVRGK